MVLRNKFKTIKFRLFAVISILTILIISIIVLVNNIVLETFYTYSKTEKAKKISSELNDYYNKSVYNNITITLREIEIRNNMDILLLGKNSEIVYYGNKEFIEIVQNSESNNSAPYIFLDKNTSIKKYDENGSNYMLLTSHLDNNYILYISIPLTPIKEAVRISNETLWLIGILMIAISGVVSLYIAKRFAEPIVQLNNITKKMSRLDFSEKYNEEQNEDEINTLGKNINIMSDKLETTINQLRKNNNQLEKDIEEKTKIDEMRKQFISDVSHELKTPISLIQGYAEGLLENVNQDEESKNFYAEVIIDEAGKMDKMVKDLLKLMKLEYGESQFEKEENIDLTEIIKEEIKRHTKTIKEENIKIDFDESKKEIVYISEENAQQLVSNYITNAIKHCKKKENEKKIVIRTDVQKNKIRLYVYNTGEKIAEADIEKIWDRFYKIDSSRNRQDGGTGIGLAIVKAIMNHYGNEYGVKNFENGVEFYCDINKNKN